MALDGSLESLQSPDTVRQVMSLAEQGNIAAIQSFLDQGGDVDCTDEDENTILQKAAANGHEQLVRLLLMRGTALDKPNAYGWTPLMHAAKYGHQNVVALLIQNNADVNKRNRWGVSVLMTAARGGHLQTCKMLVEAGIDQNPNTSIGSSCEMTPLMAAAHYGHDSVVRYLLDRGFDINYRTPSTGVNCLMLAALNGHMTTSQILIEREADPDLTNVNNQTPLEIATSQGKREVRGYLDRKTKNKPQIRPEDIKPDIIEAAKRGDIQRMREILEEDPTQRDACSPQDGATPLMFAAMIGHLDMVQTLVEIGCNVNKQDSVHGWTGLMQATYHGKKQVAKYLISNGADVLIPAKNGCTAFDMACLIDDIDTELYRLLASKAVHVNKGKGSWIGKQNGTARSAEIGNEQPKTGLKAWWNRMSNRFRNLKLGRTFSNRLGPLPDNEEVVPDSALKHSNSSHNTKASAVTSTPSELSKSVSVDTGLNSTVASNVSYETLMLETKKNASMALYTLGITAAANNIQDGTLKPILPPFFPPPAYESDRPKMPPVSSRRPTHALGSSSTLSSRPTTKFLQTYASNQNLSASPSGHKSGFTTPSPNSSGGASGISTMGRPRVASSASSSTLTAGSDRFKSGMARKLHHASSDSVFSSPPVHSQHGHSYMSSGRPHAATAFMKSSHISPNSSTSENSSLTPQKPGKSGSSWSTNSTLTPSPSPTPKAVEESIPERRSVSSQQKINSTEEDELGGILKKLSLEKYQPIFEDQEVDMDAFLTLTDTDLKELGISKNEPRVQILAAISELQSGKGRERLHFHETMTQFQNTLSSSSRNSFASASTNVNYDRWTMPENQINPENSTKSRSS